MRTTNMQTPSSISIVLTTALFSQFMQWVYESFADGAMYRMAPTHKL
jgi:hypothetical protein